jgi:hypothetical protein
MVVLKFSNIVDYVLQIIIVYSVGIAFKISKTVHFVYTIVYMMMVQYLKSVRLCALFFFNKNLLWCYLWFETASKLCSMCF